jgi:hypothetical protein
LRASILVVLRMRRCAVQEHNETRHGSKTNEGAPLNLHITPIAKETCVQSAQQGEGDYSDCGTAARSTPAVPGQVMEGRQSARTWRQVPPHFALFVKDELGYGIHNAGALILISTD